MSIEKDTRLQ